MQHVVAERFDNGAAWDSLLDCHTEEYQLTRLSLDMEQAARTPLRLALLTSLRRLELHLPQGGGEAAAPGLLHAALAAAAELPQLRQLRLPAECLGGPGSHGGSLWQSRCVALLATLHAREPPVELVALADEDNY